MLSIWTLVSVILELCLRRTSHSNNQGCPAGPTDEHNGLNFSEVEAGELDDKDVIIAVTGFTGSGKTTFISHVTGNDEGVAHGLDSGTNEIKAVRISLAEMFSVVLVDTPGFDDTDGSDFYVLNRISKWLKKPYHEEHTLSGLLYFHRISDNRMTATAKKNLQMFQKLCGSDNYNRISLVTTMWEEIDDETGAERQRELSQQYWRELLDGGAKIWHLENSRESALAILEEIVSFEAQARKIRGQRQAGVPGDHPPDTNAGQQLDGRIENVLEQHRDLINFMTQEMVLTKDPKVIAFLSNEFEELRQMRDAVLTECPSTRWGTPV